MLGFSEFDIPTVLLIMWLFADLPANRKHRKLIEEARSRTDAARKLVEITAETMKNAGIEQSPSLDSMRNSYRELSVMETALVVMKWTGPNSIITTIGGAVITHILGATTVPGALIGFAVGSPRLTYEIIRFFKRK